MGFSKPEYWSGLPLPSPGDLPDPGIKLASPALAGGFYPTEPPQKPQALPSLGFSRQEHWSGLPFPSPVHESEK